MKQTIAYITTLFLLNSCGGSSTAVKKESAPEEPSHSPQPSLYSSQTIEDEVEEINPSKKDSVLEEKATSKMRVDIYFDPDCSHCHEYSKWLESSGLSKKYAQDVEFKQICVEFMGLGKEGRCREQYKQDGEDNFLVLFSLCRASGDEYHCGVPRVFLNGKYIKDRGNIERYIKVEQTLLKSQ